MKQLTKAEEGIMQILWNLQKDNVAAVIQEMPEPKPAYNTVSTIVRILESKGFVGHEQVGKGYLYYPLVDKETYSNYLINRLLKNYFDDSFKKMILFFTKENYLNKKQLDSLSEEIKKTRL